MWQNYDVTSPLDLAYYEIGVYGLFGNTGCCDSDLKEKFMFRVLRSF